MTSKFEIDYYGQSLTLETGHLAKQANGSVLVKYGNTFVLVTAVAAKSNENAFNYFPLICSYQMKTYAMGRIPGGFIKRETKPSDNEVLTSRLIDRPIRPLFEKGYSAETQIIATVVSYDPAYPPEVAALLGASSALLISDIPFHKPVAGALVGYVDGEFVLNPDLTTLEKSKLHLFVVGTEDAITMVESSAMELPADVMLKALEFGHEKIQPLLELQKKMAKKVGLKKRELPVNPLLDTMKETVEEVASEPLKKALKIKDKLKRYEDFDKVKELVKEKAAEKAWDVDVVKELMEDVKSDIMRKMILDKGARVDGRGLTDIRNITCETGYLPKAHGSAVFTRGETQALVIATLGSKDDEQMVDEPPKMNYKKFYLHYNFPPFSVGEVGRLGAPGRREVGHGRLAERALEKVLPSPTKFPYTIRLVSEILESNGSSSMASVCGGTLALVNAGVPISQPVAGIAMGLILEGKKSAVLSDILGDEDHLGDMDFKVAGTRSGITALQMDIKIDGLSFALMKKSLDQAMEGLDFILGTLEEAISQNVPNPHNSVPRYIQLKVPTGKIREIIGPGGSVIKGITLATSAKIDISDSGLVSISSSDQRKAETALAMIQKIVGDVQIGQSYQGLLKKKAAVGFFVQCLPNVEGMIPIKSIRDPDSMKEGDTLLVKVMGYDAKGRLRLETIENAAP